MALSTTDLRNNIVGALEALSKNTERVYMGMAETYPALMQEMRETLKGGSDILKRYGRSQVPEDVALLQLIEATRDFITESNKVFASAHDSDKEIHTVLTEQLENMASLSEHIRRIHDDSSAMELISLNAMTVALKAGNQGRAFSVITEELKRLSSRTIDLTEQVTRQGDVLVSRFSEFKQLLQELNGQEEDLFGSFIERVNRGFEELTAGVRTLIDAIQQLRRRSEAVMEPLVRIMTEIQNHDLIRQSIDHVILSLKEIRPIDPNAGIEDILDELCFLEILPELCIDLLSGIADQIRGNKTVFESNLSAAQTLIDAIEQDRAKFIHCAVDAACEDGLHSRFNLARQVFDQLYEDIETLYKRKSWTVGRSHEVQYMVKELDTSFKSFENLITRFRTIDIASRIEIAKQDVLSQMSGTVNEMTSLTLRIQEDVAKSDEVTSAFLETSQRLLEQYRRDYIRTSLFSRQFIDRLRKQSAKLDASKNSLVESVNSSQVFTTTFIDQFKRTRADLDSLTALLADIERQQGLLAEIKSELAGEKQRYMRDHGIADWKLENQKLKSMIERFTIFTHKKLAGELGGFEVEQGVQSGDVTLF